ncbi:reverse transcriptase domain-containing protein [Tanacetum coccineum]
MSRRLSTAVQASVINVTMMSVHISSGLVHHQMTSDHNRSELGIQDHSMDLSKDLFYDPTRTEDLPKDNPKIRNRNNRVLRLKNRLRQRVRVPLVVSPHLPEPLPLQHLKPPPPTTSAAGNTRERVGNAPRCYKCGGLGHYARDCPNLKTLAFVPDEAGPIYDIDVEPEVDEPGDELLYPDRGEALVIQKVLNVVVSKSVDDNLWLRNNIFRTKCTSKGKICDMIIDGKTKYDGFQNTYSFKKDGVNITLVPFDSRQTQAEGSNLFMKKSGFERLMKTNPYVFTLVVVEENQIINEAPLQVQPLIKEFADVIPDDIPPGLPAMRDIQHCIDFIPAYRMNPKEFAKIQR